MARGRREILVIDEPTVGIDVKAKAYFHDLVRGLARDARAILVISSDMPELVAVSDRILVMDEYRLVGDLVNTGVYAEMSQKIIALIHDVSPRN
jgi:ribose transport system ATP-binding protein